MSAARTRLLCTVLALAAIGSVLPGAAAAQETAELVAELRAPPTRAEKIYDGAVLRPLAFVNLVGAAAVFPLAYPVTLVTGGTEQVRRFCWDVPAERVFHRPLGDL